ncbi:MAG: class I SAM-dependent methyltransferase [Candidatus Heimdallarchaeota archaeon]
MNDRLTFNIKTKRPEEVFKHVWDYYDSENIKRYAKSKSMMRIQEKITSRALELLEITPSKLSILDAGCGPGFAASYLKELGFKVVALDIILEFLKFYDLQDLNPIRADMCFLPFKPERFDAIISISALQWIFRDISNQRMESLVIALSKSFFNVLRPNCKAIFQFYPKSNEIMERIGKIFVENTKFEGNFIIDNPNNPKRRKIFLLLKKRL